MGKGRLRVTQQWHRHFDAPVALVRTASGTGETLAADDEGWLYLLERDGTGIWELELPFLPVAVGLDRSAETIVAVGESGTLAVMDRDGRSRHFERLVLKPATLDVSPDGARIAVTDVAGRVHFIDSRTGKRETLESLSKFTYVRFMTASKAVLAVGQYGQVLFMSESGKSLWEKDFRCHTRLPAASGTGSLILIPSPHFGIIALNRDGSDRGVFEVPAGPKCLCVTPDGQRIFVVNGDDDLLIFSSDGPVLFRQPMGKAFWHIECGALGTTLVAAATSGALERFAIDEVADGKRRFLEFQQEKTAPRTRGPQVVWKNKVFSKFGWGRSGQLAVTPSARHVALMDVDGVLRIFDTTGVQTGVKEKLYGLQPDVKASRSYDFVAAASSENLLALDLRSHTQRRSSLKNEWTTHFDISPRGIFMAVADYFRGISLYEETLGRIEFFETEGDVLDVRVDGNLHTLAVLGGGKLVVYSKHGTPIKTIDYPTERLSVATALGSGFAVAAGGVVETFDTDGQATWSLEVGAQVQSIQPVASGLVVTAEDGVTVITNVYGTVVRRIRRRAKARYFSAADPKETISIEARGPLLTARSSDKGVLWRHEMDDDITAMEISPEGAFVAVLSGTFLYLLSTAVGEKAPDESLFLEI